MSGKQSRARRVEAVNAAWNAVYSLRGKLPASPFTCPRQTRIFDKCAAQIRDAYWRHEATLRESSADAIHQGRTGPDVLSRHSADPRTISEIGGDEMKFLIALPSIAWRGLVLSILWGWFMVPLGLPAIGVAHAAGIWCVSGLLAGKVSVDDPNLSDEQKSKQESERVVMFYAVPLMALIFGAVIKAFMP